MGSPRVGSNPTGVVFRTWPVARTHNVRWSGLIQKWKAGGWHVFTQMWAWRSWAQRQFARVV